MTNAEVCHGFPLSQIYLTYPYLSKFYTTFEKSYDGDPIYYLMEGNNYVLPITSVVLYLLFCYFGQIIMKNRKPFNLQYTLAAWNLFLSVFSAWGAIRTVPELLHMITHMDFEHTVCKNAYSTYGAGASGFATQMFILSKIPELVDTVFIVLRKKPLIFLHWYHHVTVLLFCWNAYVDRSANGLYFVAMNYTVHAVMYFYYFLMAMKKIPKWFPSWIITLMQISQMIIGTFIVGITSYYANYGGKLYQPGECSITNLSLYTGGIIYASYLYLFVEFAVKRFIFGIKEEGPGGDKKKAIKKVD
eukprot:CAMPEP_0202967178 /NCGR_PEP_ID=MMETSP1396-20130829/11959_1 /ASSEMBLY_ACC=CAM_ASM_000872 /TAXON_ID= /ORGANISM="Pseudokeronopsis sp., Strain Brazil" /LENGTH=301 /DNA_ID=CAMNT_0049691935 /DNA_START=81 /DNA_END=986 /DNA_ORIENTATION=-